jgi:hypothetical protein
LIPQDTFENMSAEQALSQIRAIRNELLAEYVDKINGVRWAAMTTEQQDAWTAYRKALLDITLGGTPMFPFKVEWPVAP